MTYFFTLFFPAIGGEHISATSAEYLSVLFDGDGIIGGILAGFISDQLNAREKIVSSDWDSICCGICQVTVHPQ